MAIVFWAFLVSVVAGLLQLYILGDVDLMLWRGAYSLEHVLLYKANGEVDRPLFKADYVEFTLSWTQLLDGAAVGRVVVNSPEINFIDSNASEKRQITPKWCHL